MQMRSLARRFGRDFYCSHDWSQVRVTRREIWPQFLGKLPSEERQAVTQWLTRSGPFWEDGPRHGTEDYFLYNDDFVTNSAVGEVAFRRDNGDDARLISMRPSDWSSSPLTIVRHIDDQTRDIPVQNYWEVDHLGSALEKTPLPIESWTGLQTIAVARFKALTFAKNWCEPLTGHPFSDAVSRRVLNLLHVLDRLKSCVNERQQNTEEANLLRAHYFVGDRAWYSNSSPAEISKFRRELTFPHPGHGGERLFCPWHGKISTGVLRLHFSWPVTHNQPLYVVYLGPKITKH